MTSRSKIIHGPAGRRIAVLALAFLAAAGALAGTPPAPAAARETGEVSVVLDALTPTVARPGRSLRLVGRVVNGSEQQVADLRVGLHASTVPLGSRSEISETEVSDDPLARAGPLVAGTTRRMAGPLLEGQSAPFTMKVPLSRLGFDEFGVYAIGLEVTGTSATDATPRTLGSVTTYVPWAPPGSGVDPTRLAMIWPLVGTPSRDAEGVFRSDTFGTSLVRGGRLRVLLGSASRWPVTWMVDPETLEAVSAMADGYRVRAPREPSAEATGEGGGDARTTREPGQPSTPSPGPEPTEGDAEGTVPGAYAEDADAWLEEARTVLSGADVLALPYADPDLVALQRRGLEEDLTLATTTGRLTVTEVLGRSVAGDVIWPPEGQLNQATLEALRLAGVRGVVLHGSARPPEEDLYYTPTGRARLSTLGGPLDAALVDDTLSDVLTLPSATPGSDLLARQRFLAETAMISAERPGDGRSVLVAPPRRWRPDPDFAQQLLPALARAPWVRQISMDELLSEPVPDIPRQRLHYDRQTKKRELSASHLLPVRTMRADLQEFAGILASPGGDTTAPYDLAILRTESSAWRSSVRAGRQLRERVRAQLDDQRNGVYVAADRLVTLTSKRGRFPITIANDLDVPVEVKLALTPRQQTRMTVRSPPVQRIGGGRKKTLEVPAEARANGVVMVDAQLRTPHTGEPYGAPVPIAVRATEYGTIAYVITGAAFVVLFAAAGIRVVRRARATRRRGRSHEPGEAATTAGEESIDR